MLTSRASAKLRRLTKFGFRLPASKWEIDVAGIPEIDANSDCSRLRLSRVALSRSGNRSAMLVFMPDSFFFVVVTYDKLELSIISPYTTLFLTTMDVEVDKCKLKKTHQIGFKY